MGADVPTWPREAKVFYFLREDGWLLRGTTNDKEELDRYFSYTNMIKHYAITTKEDMISMLYDLKTNFGEVRIQGVNIKRTEERYSITQNDYFREAVRVAAKEDLCLE